MSVDIISTALGVAGTIFIYWTHRTLMPLVNVRLDATTCPDRPDLLRIALEVENQSQVSLKRTGASLQIDEHDLPEAGAHLPDWQDPGSHAIDVVRTEKLEPRELIHTEVLYRWGAKPLLQCRFSFGYDSWLCRLYHGRQPDRHTVVKWIVKPSPP